LDERAAAIASPSLVFLEARVDGYLRLKATGQLVESKSVTVTHKCSGFVVSADGYVVTAGHCVQPSLDSLRGTAAYIVADDLVRDNKLTMAQRDGFIHDAMSNTDFVGEGGAAPSVKVYGQLFVATSGLTSAPAAAARVVSSQAVSRGDVALVKLAQHGLPVAELGTAVPAVDSHVVQLAFGTNDAPSATTLSYTVRSTGAITLGTYAGKNPPMYRMDSDLGNAADGGMVVDDTGQVVGMINEDTAKDTVNHLMSDVATIRKVIDAADVHNQQSAVDRDYAAGLDAYFAGRYSEAIKKFDGVLAASPGNKVVRSYRDQAQLRLSIEGDKGAGGAWLWIALAGGGLVIVVGLLVGVLALRRRARRRAGRLGFAVDPFAPPTQGPFPPTFNPVSGMPYSVSGAPFPVSGTPFPVSGAPFPVSGTPYTVAPVSADPDQRPAVTETPATDEAGHANVRVRPVAEDPAPKWAGVPVPVSPPHGVVVQHPAWPARAPIALPEPPDTGEATPPGPVPAETTSDQGTPRPPMPDSPWAAPPRQQDQTDRPDGSLRPDQPESERSTGPDSRNS
jgi:hypothetical protein